LKWFQEWGEDGIEGSELKRKNLTLQLNFKKKEDRLQS
jgi:hypothetical protein